MKILVTAAHADDIEFGVAGSASRWIKEGAEVMYCIITDGSAGSNDPETDLEQLVALRQEEQRAAARLVGVENVCFLGFPDGVLESTLDLRRAITRVIRQFKPDRVVCQDPTFVLSETNRYINHPDHRAAGEATLYAVFPSAETRPVFPELLAEGCEPHHVSEVYLFLTHDPNRYIDITDTIDVKLEALACHKSQSINEETLKMVRSWNAESGKRIDGEYAEVFRVMSFER